jgi:hypothetical protein
VAHYALGDAAERQVREPGASVGSHDDQIELFTSGRFGDGLGGLCLDEVHLEAFARRRIECRQEAVGLAASFRFYHLVYRLLPVRLYPDGKIGPDVHADVPGVKDMRLRAEVFRNEKPVFERHFRAFGAIDGAK